MFVEPIAVFAESVVSFYPILIKLTSLDVPFNTFLRLTSYFVISSLFANYEILQGIGLPKLIALASVNIVHILSSYYGFRWLNPSLAESIFYMYPFLNLVLSSLFLNESISLIKYALLVPVLFCVHQIYDVNKVETNTQQNLALGIPMIVVAAITESFLFLLIRSIDLGNNPWNSLLVSYALSAVLYGIYYVYQYGIKDIQSKWKSNRSEILKLIGANMAIGSFGYGLRFWSIPRLSSVTQAIISYSGIFTTLLYSFLFGFEHYTSSKLMYLVGLVVSLYTMKTI